MIEAWFMFAAAAAAAAGSLLQAGGRFLGEEASGAATRGRANSLNREAGMLDEAANMEEMNARIARASGDIQETAARRQLYQVQSGTAADLGGAGLSLEGSGGDILRANAQQGALQQGMIGLQTTLNVNSYLAQANAYRREAAGARSAALAASQAPGGNIMGLIGGVLGAAGSFAGAMGGKKGS